MMYLCYNYGCGLSKALGQADLCCINVTVVLNNEAASAAVYGPQLVYFCKMKDSPFTKSSLC